MDNSKAAATYEKTKWALTDLLVSPEAPETEEILSGLKSLVSEIVSRRDALIEDMSGDDFTAFLRLIEKFAVESNRLTAYSQLWFSEDTQSQSALTFMGRIEQLLTDMYNETLFWGLWWKSIGDEDAQRLMGHAGDLRYYLERERAFKKHTLTEPEEKIINLKDVNGINAVITIYDMLTSKYEFGIEVDGQMIRPLTRDALMSYVHHSNPVLREAAYKELFRVYCNDEILLSQLYAYRVRDWASEHVRIRNHDSAISVRNLANDIPNSVVDTLLPVCVEESHVFQRYFNIKSRLLGLPKLRRYDIYASVRRGDEHIIPYNTAVETVLDSFNKFSPKFGALAKRVFDEARIDAEDRPNKRTGAFCYGVLPNMTPWVLMNYTGKPRQVATLAHELGHAVHALAAAQHSVLTFHAPLPLAETASVFSEMLLTERMLQEEGTQEARTALVCSALDDIYATVLRQAYFVLFEREAHGLLADGANPGELNTLYLNLMRRQFGDSVELTDDFQHEWMAIPHIFHTPFYCYAYSFGELLSLSLYNMYKEEGRGFVDKLLKILSYGGSASPQHILNEAGIDITDSRFWHGGFRVIDGFIDKLL
ncbi:M3 family oligoendopeptidase [Candidatus Magnetominusculus xianensis]|uniref:PepF/M3 family oligoendopeptidase n=1 Tax=Candidatus Magnetominusculus xianensis TaxID=1748249 RepID=A0ABR5SIH5_9BACT|nr:M3 family oligoendopeptidase [Candidatus Magnetominusculus xianensis]KWT92701.1 pepF/M3 family oligoendopeptidase [Candidatus Magnetominusculus xianensis]MBF0403748.1 M3 family oligoendopeptidase [Nitrospirota bacterium]